MPAPQSQCQAFRSPELLYFIFFNYKSMIGTKFTCHPIPLFKVYNWVVFSIVTEFCNQ